MIRRFLGWLFYSSVTRSAEELIRIWDETPAGEYVELRTWEEVRIILEHQNRLEGFPKWV